MHAPYTNLNTKTHAHRCEMQEADEKSICHKTSLTDARNSKTTVFG